MLERKVKEKVRGRVVDPRVSVVENQQRAEGRKAFHLESLAPPTSHSFPLCSIPDSYALDEDKRNHLFPKTSHAAG